MSFVGSLLAGCSSMLSAGENVLYSDWNGSARSLESVNIISPDGRNRYLAGARAHPGGPDYLPISPGGFQYFAENGHRVPDQVAISWRELPPPGAEPYTGELKGPYTVDVRSRIPKDVLPMAGRDGYALTLMFSVGELPILFNWRLIAFGKVTGKGIQKLRCGGDAPDRHCKN